MFYLIEPFNAYQQPPRKKHWMEVAEEERLFMLMVEEQRKAESVKQQKLAESLEANQNPFTKDAKTFLLNKDDGDMPSTIGHGGPASGAGNPPYQFFNPHIILAFTSSVVSGHIPFSVHFTNLETGDIQFVNYKWDFGDGTTSTQTHPNHTYNKTGSFDVSLTGSAQSNAGIISFLRVNAYISSST